MILHALEDDQAAARRLDPVMLNAECRPDAELSYLVFDQPLDGLFQRFLNFADADGASRLHQATLDQRFGKEMALTGTAPAVGSLVTRLAK
jgi:hypothetical protein